MLRSQATLSMLSKNQGMLEEGVSFLQKPFTKKEIMKKVHDVLKGETGE